MQALIKAGRHFNPKAVDVKDYAHVRRAWREYYPVLKKPSSEEMVDFHRFCLKNCPTRESFTLLCEKVVCLWEENGEGAFVKSVSNFLAGGKYDNWWRGAGLTAGIHPHFPLFLL